MKIICYNRQQRGCEKMSSWTLNISKFGKIKKASIQIAPFTLFVGDNNTGKSYLMTLIYGMLNLSPWYFRDKMDEDSEDYKQCREWILEQIYNEKTSERKNIRISRQIYPKFISILNAALFNNKESLMERFFNYPVEIEDIKFNIPYNKDIEFLVNYRYPKDDDDMSEENVRKAIFTRDRRHGELWKGFGLESDIVETDIQCIISYMISSLIKFGFVEGFSEEACYLPTSRTGFILTYKLLTEKSMKGTFNSGDPIKNLVTRPCSDFLVSLSKLTSTSDVSRYPDVVSFIEEKLIDGHINVYQLPTNDIKYQPNESDEDLPMFLSSGVITEMTPLLLFLKYKANMGTLMMEEPEMCLHPKLQQLIARTLIRIVNAKMPVFITTHSDILLQHINNMIKLSNLKNKQELMEQYGYTEEDLISKDDIMMYQLDGFDNNYTKVTKLNAGEYGFTVPTFNDALDSILNEVYAFQDEE